MSPGSRIRAGLLGALLAISSALPAAAREVSDAPTAAAAEALYQEGKQLLLQGSTDLACARLQASQSVQPGIGTLLLLGHCYELLGRSASAWATFRAAESVARASRQTERAEIARVRAAALEPRLSRLSIQLPVGADTREWSVRVDERVLPVASLGTSLPVDPGEHEIAVSAPGFEPWSARVPSAPEGGVARVRVGPLTAQSEPTQPPTAVALRPAGALSPAPEPALDWQRAFGYGATGLGAAGLALGLGFTLHAQQQYDESLSRCRTETLCSPTGIERRHAAERSARVATIASVSGAALALGGLALWWTAPDREAPELALSALPDPNGVGLAAQGSF